MSGARNSKSNVEKHDNKDTEEVEQVQKNMVYSIPSNDQGRSYHNRIINTSFSYDSMSSNLSPFSSKSISPQYNNEFQNSFTQNQQNTIVSNDNRYSNRSLNSSNDSNVNTNISSGNTTKPSSSSSDRSNISSKINVMAPSFIPASEYNYFNQTITNQSNQIRSNILTAKSPNNYELSLSHQQGAQLNQINVAKTNPQSGFVYQIQFKRRTRYYVPCTAFSEIINVGDYVKVEADRGEDIGLVTSILNVSEFYLAKQESLRNSPIKEEETAWEVKQILKLATAQEKNQLVVKFNEESGVLMKARDLCERVYKLPIIVVDVEYQFDRHKLTVMYDCNRRVDFREFVRDLFAIYKTRIWMQQVDSKDSLLVPIKKASPSSVSIPPYQSFYNTNFSIANSPINHSAINQSPSNQSHLSYLNQTSSVYNTNTNLSNPSNLYQQNATNQNQIHFPAIQYNQSSDSNNLKYQQNYQWK